MHLLSYRGMVMRIIQSLPHVRTPELDESRATYKWTRWDLSFIVTVEPAALSVISNIPPGTANTPPPVRNAADIQAGDGTRSMPALTDAAIRRFLEYPRGTLIVQGLNLPAGPGAPGAPLNVLVSPAPGMSCDANNGPFCKVNSVQEVAGESLWQIHLTFTTYIYEDSLGGSQQKAPILISNRWAVITDTNELQLTDRIVDGIVSFRADQLLNNGQVADFYRSVFAGFTVPSGFQRKNVHCTLLPQGNMVRYRILDREQPYQQKQGGQVRLEYVERSWMWHGSMGRAAVNAIANDPGAVPIGNPVAIGQWFRNRVFGMANAVGAQLPKRYKTVIARAWGNRLANRGQIVQMAMMVAQSRIGMPALILPYTAEVSISYHSAQMMAQVENTINWTFNTGDGITAAGISLASLLFQNQNGLPVGDLLFSNFAGADGDASTLLVRAQNSIQPPFPGQSGTHGTWALPQFDPNYLARLATQTLETIGQAPAAPP